MSAATANTNLNDLSETKQFYRPGKNAHRIGDSALAERLRHEIEGEVLFDAFSRGRYSTDASVYQVEPIGVVVPRNSEDVATVLQICAEEEVSVLPRGGGSSQCGQTVGESVVIDLGNVNELIDLNPEKQTCVVQPGIVLDHLNAVLKKHDLLFPVDVSTSSRATIGGMTANNSCGTRSIVYGSMRDNVLAIEALFASGERAWLGEHDVSNSFTASDGVNANVLQLIALGENEKGEIKKRFPDLMRRVGGYNIDALIPAHNNVINLAHLLVGSEGTLAYSNAVKLKLSPLPKQKVLGVCHFPTFYQAMDAAQHIVKLSPSTVELIDKTMIDLSRGIAMFRQTVDRFVMGEPQALLLVEFAGDDLNEQLSQVDKLDELMCELGFQNAVLRTADATFQKAIWDVRKAGLNIMMSMKGDGKPISFVEDCAVRLQDLAEYTERLTQVFEKHGTTGTWYAHASVGCLHVRPVINLKQDLGANQMRGIAEAAFEMVREYKGSHSGEHGDGMVRSEFHETMFGSRMVVNFEKVKDLLDPNGLFNPGKIVRPSRMDDRTLMRFKPGYKVSMPPTALDWSNWGGFGAAVEMCNNNGACRNSASGVMCPSYRVTQDEKDLTRGRANTLRLAVSGQLGKDALLSDDMLDTMKLCVSCKGCKRECPTGVDMARMKTEFLYHYKKRHGLTLQDRLIAWLPRYAPAVSKVAVLVNLLQNMPGSGLLCEHLAGLSAKRSLPGWSRKAFQSVDDSTTIESNSVVMFVDTFNRYFDPQIVQAAQAVLTAAGYKIHLPAIPKERPLCCGRTFLSAGLVDQAREEASRVLQTLKPYLDKNVPVIGLEPSCLLGFRDEYEVLGLGEAAKRLSQNALLFEEFLERELDAGNLTLPLKSLSSERVLVHGHCHQKAFGLMGGVEKILRQIPDLEVSMVESSCCGMAGAFGYAADTYDVSVDMANLTLVPAVKAADKKTLVVANGTSCRHQIKDLAFRDAVHIAQVLQQALA